MATDATALNAHAGLLYVANTGNNSITVYRDDAAGNTAPLATIAGSKTMLSSPGQLAQDAAGNLYVANGYLFSPGNTPAILVFAHGASGNVAPLRVLSGPATGLHHVQAMTVDKQSGKMFVIDGEPTNGQNLFASLLRFDADAGGNTAPLARSANTLNEAYQLTFDSTGKHVMDAHFPDAPNAAGYGVGTLPKQFPAAATLSYVYNTAFFGANGIVDDPASKSYLVTNYGGIYRFAESTTGEGPGGPGGQTFSPAPMAVISSDTCGNQLTLGSDRSIYVTHSIAHGSCASDAVDVYAHDAAGNAAPIRVLSGAATGLSAPYGIYAGK